MEGSARVTDLLRSCNVTVSLERPHLFYVEWSLVGDRDRGRVEGPMTEARARMMANTIRVKYGCCTRA